MSFETRVKKQLRDGEWDLIEKFDNGTKGANEVGHVRLRDGMVKNEKLPSKETYRGWLEGSEYMTPPEVVKAGGKIIWLPEWDV